MAELEPADLDALYRRLLASDGSGGRPLAPGTVKRILGILRRALDQGVKWGWIGINPATATTPPRVPPSDIEPPSPGSLGRVLRRAVGAFGVSLVASTLLCMARRADELHDRVVVANPEDCSPAAFRVLIDEVLTPPDPEIESLDVAAVLETIRAESEHA